MNLFERPEKIDGPPVEGEIAIVELPVKVIFEWSDKIVADVDEFDNPVEFKSGYIMRIIGNQSFVYNNEKRQALGFAFKEL